MDLLATACHRHRPAFTLRTVRLVFMPKQSTRKSRRVGLIACYVHRAATALHVAALDIAVARLLSHRHCREWENGSSRADDGGICSCDWPDGVAFASTRSTDYDIADCPDTPLGRGRSAPTPLFDLATYLRRPCHIVWCTCIGQPNVRRA